MSSSEETPLEMDTTEAPTIGGSPLKAAEKSVDEATSTSTAVSSGSPMKSPGSQSSVNQNGNGEIGSGDESEKGGEGAPPPLLKGDDDATTTETEEVANDEEPMVETELKQPASTDETSADDDAKDAAVDEAADDSGGAPVVDASPSKKKSNKKGSPKKSPSKSAKSPKKAAKAEQPPAASPPTKEKSPPAPSKSPVKRTADAEATPTDDSKIPLLQAPLVMEGKRERKTIERLALSTPTSTKKSHTEVPQGSGTKLGEIDYVDTMISKTKSDELKPLHRLLFGRPGTSNEVKKNLRQFCGFSDSTLVEKKRTQLSSKSWPTKDLKRVCQLCGVERGGTKEELVSRICAFIASPRATSAKVPQPKKKSTGGTKRKRSASSGGGGKKSAVKASSAKKSDDDDEGSPSDNDDSDSGKEEEEGQKKKDDEDNKSDSDAAEEKSPSPPPAKKAKKAAKKPVPTPKSSAANKKSTATTPKQKSKKDAKSKSPSNDDLSVVIKGLLKGVDLEKVTMKEMCKKVFDKFPEENLSAKKDFIKNTVKKLISETA